MRERDPQHPGVRGRFDLPHVSECSSGCRERCLPVQARGERTSPGIEQLRSAGAGLDLEGEEASADVGEPLCERVPPGRVLVDQAARGEMVLRGPALDEVGSEGERGAREADERERRAASNGLGGEHLGRAAHSLDDRPAPLGDGPRVDRGDPRNVGTGANRLGEDRTPARDDAHVDPRQHQGHDDVAEEDRGIHAVTAHGLQRDLTHERGVEAGVEHRAALTQRTVLGKGTPRLPHEPHGGDSWSVSDEGADEVRVLRRVRNERMLIGELHS